MLTSGLLELDDDFHDGQIRRSDGQPVSRRERNRDRDEHVHIPQSRGDGANIEDGKRKLLVEGLHLLHQPIERDERGLKPSRRTTGIEQLSSLLRHFKKRIEFGLPGLDRVCTDCKVPLEEVRDNHRRDLRALVRIFDIPHDDLHDLAILKATQLGLLTPKFAECVSLFAALFFRTGTVIDETECVVGVEDDSEV